MQYYRVGNSNFTENGDIKLQPSSGVLKMELNGICEIEIVHPYDEEGRWKQIERFGVIKSPVCYIKNEQLFRIYDIDKGMFGLTVKARHIFFDLVRHTILDNRAVNTTGKGALDIIFNGTRFTGHSDIDTYNTAYFVRMNSIQAINGDKDNTFMKRWGGEIFPDNFDIHINKKIGGDYGVKVKYSQNMIDVNLSENTDEIVTRAYPVAADGIMLPEKYVDSPLINKYPLVLENFIEMSDLKLKDKEHESEDDEGFETEAELYQAMRNRVRNLFDEGLDKPKISGAVEMAVLEDTDDYKYFTNLVNVAMGDTVEVEHLDIGINTKTRCVGIEWDILTKKYNAVTLGELESDYFDSKDVTTDKLDTILNNNGTVNSSMLEGVMNAMDTKFKALRDVAQPQEVRAILFEDRIKGSKTYGAMCLGSMGFEIASERTPDDKAWIWKTFGTGQGFVADCMTTGVLNADLIRAGVLTAILIQSKDGGCSINLETGEVNFNKGIIRGKNCSFNLNTGELISYYENIVTGEHKCSLKNGKLRSTEYARISGNQGVILTEEDDNSRIVASMFIQAMAVMGFSKGLTISTPIMDIWDKGEKMQSFRVKSNSISLNSNSTSIEGTLNVFGNKNCIQRTKAYGNVPFYANEDINSLLTKTDIDNIYETTLQNTGKYKCIVPISEMIKECINTDMPYNVNINKLGSGDIWTANTYPGYFVIESDRPIKFKYKLEGRRKGFEEMNEELVFKKAYETKIKKESVSN